MDIYGVPFGYRIALLALVLAAVAASDLRRRGVKSTKWPEYAFLAGAGLAGGLLGAAIDLVNSSISPEFFVFGKGLAPGMGFQSRVFLLGCHAGCLVGAVAAGSYLLANNPRKDLPALPYTRLARLALLPVFCALLGAALAGLTTHLASPLHLVRQLGLPLEHPDEKPLAVVWGLNLGLYLGFAPGVVWGVLKIRRARRLLAGSSLVQPTETTI